MNKEKIPEIKYKDFWSKLWLILKPSRPLMRSILIIITLGAILDIVKPYMIKLVIDRLTNFQPEDLWLMFGFVGLFLISDQIRSVMRYFSDSKIFRVLVDIEYYLGIRAQQKLVYLPLSYHEKENTGNKIVKIDRGITRISDLVGSIFWEVAPIFVQLIFSVAALFWSDWRLGISLLFFSPFFLFLTYQTNKKMYPVRKEIYKSYEQASGKMAQSIININAVQSFSQEDNELKSFDKIKSAIRKNETWQWIKVMGSNLGRNIIVDFGNAVTLVIGVYLVYLNDISIGTMIFAFTLSTGVYGALHRLSRFYDRMEEGKEGVRRLADLFDTESDLIVKENGLKPIDIQGEIEFRNVSFGYGENTKMALINVNFKIDAGTMVALIGPSGGGKTTLARLIYRHYDTTKGEILLDGENLRNYDLHGFRKFMVIVPQEVEVFDLSVQENIAYAKPEATREEVEAAAQIANAHDFITKLDKGYETLVGERGIKLSGGQRQRIGIARAILANPRILIFDEATSNLDSESEHLIQDAMNKISQNRTLIVIAHRLSTISKADKIIVLEEGLVAEEGTHAELSKKKHGLYAKLLDLQKIGEVK